MNFLSSEAQSLIASAVAKAEQHTSAEIVVTVTERAERHRDVEPIAGALFAFLTLALLIYSPWELDDALMPIETLAAFVLVATLVHRVPALKRVLLSPERRRAASERWARACFVEQRIATTRERTGILVGVALLERKAAVVPDIGIDASLLGDAWTAALSGLEAAVANCNVQEFADRLAQLGPILESRYPRREDDINELPDAPVMLNTSTKGASR